MENYKVVLTGTNGERTQVATGRSLDEARIYAEDMARDELEEVKNIKSLGDVIRFSHLKNGYQVQVKDYTGELVTKLRFTIEK